MLQSLPFSNRLKNVPIVVIKILIALGLDQLLGEPRRWHPLVGFGLLAERIEQRLNQAEPGQAARLRWRGLLAWGLAVLPLPLLIALLSQSLETSILGFMLDVSVLYLCIGRRSLREHSLRVKAALQTGDLDQARHHTSMIVSRECEQLDGAGCARATVESVLENGNDSVFGALFWFALLGSAGAVLYRLANTLDAMWGYRNQRFLQFGWAAARLDDLLNYLPARICALCYALAGHSKSGLQCWRRQARQLSSPNGGPVMCAGAGALNLRLGGPARYHGKILQKPWFGGEFTPSGEHIRVANDLLDRALLVFLAALMLLSVLL